MCINIRVSPINFRLYVEFVRICQSLHIDKTTIATRVTNQRTNGPVNAHLISGTSISTKHTKPG